MATPRPECRLRRVCLPVGCIDCALHIGVHAVCLVLLFAGLGQKNMSFVDDREDINSIALTAVSATPELTFFCSSYALGLALRRVVAGPLPADIIRMANIS